MHPRIIPDAVSAPFRVAIDLAEASHWTLDLTRWSEGKRGVFAALQDPDFFAQVRVDPDAETIAWPDGIVIDPDVPLQAAHTAPSRPRGTPAKGGTTVLMRRGAPVTTIRRNPPYQE